MDIIELAWAAGFYDGEGSTTLSNKYIKGRVPHKPSIRMSIAQCEDRYGKEGSIPEVLLRFQKAIGHGTIVYVKARSDKHRAQYLWWACGFDCTLIYEKIGAYLSSEKRIQYQNHVVEAQPIKRTKKTDTKCKRGHLLIPSNLYASSNGSRICKICSKIRYNKGKISGNFT